MLGFVKYPAILGVFVIKNNDVGHERKKRRIRKIRYKQKMRFYFTIVTLPINL
jgi:hypothetical protein